MHRDPAEQADLYERFVYRSALSENTARAYARCVRVFLRFVASDADLYGEALTDPHARDFAVKEWRRGLLTNSKYAPATVQQYLTAVSSFYEWLGMGRPANASVDVPRPDKSGLPEDDLRRLMRAARKSGPRNYAILATLAGTGIRVGEAAALDVDDAAITARTGRLDVRYGKGGKPRQVPLSPQTRAAVRDWLDVRPGDPNEGPLWVSRKGGRMAARTIEATVSSLAVQAKVTATPHTLRHTFARRLVDGGVPLPDVQKLMGHRSVSTTAGYGNATAEDLERAVTHAEIDH